MPDPALPTTLRLHVASHTHPGKLRHRNEDAFLVAGFGAGAVLAVCDGMGGAAGGAEASQCAVESLERTLLVASPPSDRDELGRRLLSAVTEASRRVRALASERPHLRGMGCTATVCGLVDDQLVIAQVGDSRAYLLRAGCLTQLTRDQTLVTLLVEQGQLSPEDARGAEYGHVILQAVGGNEPVEVDLRTVRVCDGDVLLVCSDGLSGPVEDEKIRALLSAEPDCARAAAALVALANDAGGPDNVTCIVARVSGASPGRAAAPDIEKLHLRLEPDDPAPRTSDSGADRSRSTCPEPNVRARGPDAEAEGSTLRRLLARLRPSSSQER